MGMFDYRAPSMKFPKTGVRLGGRVTDVREGHRRKYRADGSGQLEYWQDGKPVEGAATNPVTGEPNRPVTQYEITVDTGAPVNEDGETEQTIYFGKQRLEKAFKAEAKRVRLRNPDDLIGWNLWVTKTGQEVGAGGVMADTWAVELEPAGEPVAVAAAPAPAQVDEGLAARQREATQRLARTVGAAPKVDDEPPF
jgi:hypothetical protein